jgi:hypothetical protein
MGMYVVSNAESGNGDINLAMVAAAGLGVNANIQNGPIWLHAKAS